MSGKQMIVKDNALVLASYSLNVSEQRLLFMAIIAVREMKNFEDVYGEIHITAKDYAAHFGVELHTAYEAIERAALNLYELRGFSYSKFDEKSGKVGRYESRWISTRGEIKEAGRVTLQFDRNVIPLITRLSQEYTEYELKMVASLTSEYAIRLYEMIIKWRKTGKTNLMTVEYLREALALGDKYQRMETFRRCVINTAVKQINTHTDINVTYTQEKKGRKIIGFIFRFTKKTDGAGDKTSDKPKKPKPLTKKQLDMYASILSNDSAFGSKYANSGESVYDFKNRIFQKLRTEDGLTKLLPHLIKLGFKPQYRREKDAS